MELEKFDALYKDRANWRWGLFYCCPSDPRVIAPSRPDWRGYQINFAHPHWASVLILYLAVLLVPMLLTFLFGPQDPARLALAAGLVFFVSVVSLIRLSVRLSGRRDA